MKYIIVGDLHGGKDRNSSIFHRTLLKYALWIKKLANEQGIKNIIQLGDVFDNRFQISVETLKVVSTFFDVLSDFNIDIITGNHDCVLNDSSKVNSLTPFKRHPNITIHEGVTERDGLVFTGWGVKLEDIPKCDYLFGHYDTVGFELQKGKISTHGFKANDVMEKVNKMLFSGHYHRPQVKLYDDKPFYYTGSAFPLDWNDADSQKFVYILDSKSNKLDIIPNNISPKFTYIRDEKDLSKVSNNFVAISYNSNDKDNSWKKKIENLNPLGIKTEIVSEKVGQKNIEDADLKEFKVVAIENIIEDWVKNSLTNLSDDELEEVAKRSKKKYILTK